ncbi:sarcosine oxidase subunit gamma [Roseibium hamelinense]|uniref:Sarcosine oxidase subunit gamma n=1 Tax=Roseibium hamelinense TaxID=150831 RepID=A0A562TJ37_9HYPH|nr:sarcosine oxidase subunit gamma family protein [Roseibium hamelinense]MTI46117.1 sarcosine oxidase subunit gamma [Roseibium hamelinense]TWI92690.1 sarcosine oxidase subunit gamma [Roseibium hamelinense]
MSDLLASEIYAPDAAETPLLAIAGVSVLKAAPVTRLSFRGREKARVAAGKAFGADLPVIAMTATVSGNRVAQWMGPDEWTLLAPETDLSSVWERLEGALSAEPHALVDISDRQLAILVSGEKAAWLLNSGVPIDLHESALPVGTVTRTLYHKVPVVLWRIGPDTFVVEAWVSFMDYVSGLLVQAAEELKAA